MANNPPFSGGERDAINCVQLYRATHDKKHLDLAKHYLDIRGLENSVNRSRHNQSYKPVLEQSEAVGHAVNCVTLMVSLADVGVLTGIKEYFNAAQRMWPDAVERKMYITGGVGTTGNEGFGEPYSLPNISAYSETCAVLMFITLNHRLFMATGDAKYIDVMERGMYNNAHRRRLRVRATASSTSTGWPAPATDATRAGSARRSNAVRRISCGSWRRCPASSTRRTEDDAIYVNLYVSSEASFTVGGERPGAGGRERDAVGRQIADHGVGQRDRSSGTDQAAHSRLGAEPARARRPVRVRGQGRQTAGRSRSTARA